MQLNEVLRYISAFAFITLMALLFIRRQNRPKYDAVLSKLLAFVSVFFGKDSRRCLMSIRRDLLLDAQEMRKNGENEPAIRKKMRHQMILAYLALATAPITRALRAPFRWRD